MTWISRLKSFKFYCELHGYGLLTDDYRFIYEGLFMVPKNDHRRILGRYIEEWRVSMGRAQEAADGGQGAGRRSANNWFREYVERFKNRIIDKERDAIS